MYHVFIICELLSWSASITLQDLSIKAALRSLQMSLFFSQSLYSPLDVLQVLWWKWRRRKPQHPLLLSHFISDCRLRQTGSAVAVGRLARWWGVCFRVFFPSVCLVSTQPRCLLHRRSRNTWALSLCQDPWAKTAHQASHVSQNVAPGCKSQESYL